MGDVKTTLDLPDDLFRESKARAALRGQSLKAFVAEALTSYLAEPSGTDHRPPWQTLFGRVSPSVIREVDERIESELGRVDEDQWK